MSGKYYTSVVINTKDTKNFMCILKVGMVGKLRDLKVGLETRLRLGDMIVFNKANRDNEYNLNEWRGLFLPISF